MILVSKHPQSEAEKYLLKAEAIKFGDPNKIIEFAEKAAASASDIGDFKLYALALYYLSWAYVIQGYYESSITNAIEAMLIAREHRYVDIEFLSVNVICVNFTTYHLVTEATWLFDYQQNLAERLPDLRLKCCLLNDFAVLKSDAGKYEESIELFKQSLECLADSNVVTDAQYRALISTNITRILTNLKDFDNALLYGFDGIRNAQIAQSDDLLLVTYTNVAAVYIQKSDIEKAYEYLHLAGQYFNSDMVFVSGVIFKRLQAQIFQYEERYDDAIRLYEESYSHAIHLGEVELARDALENIKAIYEKLNDIHGVMNAYRRLADDIPKLRDTGADLRLEVLRVIFSSDAKAPTQNAILSNKKKKMLERISHEFRTPLSIIQTSTDLIEMYNDRMTLEQRQSKMRNISHQVKWMTVMLENVVEVMRLEEKTDVVLDVVETSLQELINSTLTDLKKYQMTSERVKIEIDSTPTKIKIPRQPLKTVIVHLLVNALKFSQQEVVLKLHLKNDHLHLEVIDQGIGIPADELETVFLPMERGSNLDEVTGLGMGLSIVEQLVTQMRGKMKLNSTENVGTQVMLDIPCIV